MESTSILPEITLDQSAFCSVLATAPDDFKVHNPFIWPCKNDSMGPSARKGKNVKTTRTKVLAISMRENVKLSVLRPAPVPLFLPIIEPESASSKPIGP
jgi:hypothetical protein